MIAPAVPASRDVDDITDHELVARIRAGDDRAFECLYRRYHRRIAGYIQGMVHDHARAEDIAQDVFMSALRRMRDTDRPIAFKPWIYEIAKNACIDQFRRARRAEEVSYDAEDGLASADYGRLVTKDPSPEVRYETKQQLDHLRGAFGGLSETHHQILVMRELEGLSYREIGERMGMTRPAVESTLFRARRRLTEEYEELVTGERCQRVQSIIATASAAALGTRDRRRVARHVSYCQPCLRQARVSGMDASDLVAKPLRAKVAALLPLPAFLRDRLSGSNSDGAALPHAHHLGSWSAQLGSIDPSIVTSWGRAAATAATIAIAGVGAGVVTDPPTSVQAALGGGGIADRLGDDDRSSSSRAAAAPQDAGAGTGAVATGRTAGAIVLGGSQDGRGMLASPATRPDGDADTDAESTTTSTTSASGTSTPTTSSGGTTTTTAKGRRGSLSDTLTRIAGGEGSSDSGSGGGGSTSIVPSLPKVPAVEAPSVSVPQQTPSTSPDPVGTVGETVQDAGSAVTDAANAAEGILAGE